MYESPSTSPGSHDFQLRCFEARTARLKELTNFVDRFTPGIGAHVGYDGRDVELPGAVEDARNSAVGHAFEAIEKIARETIAS